jgi:hypothetical protein
LFEVACDRIKLMKKAVFTFFSLQLKIIGLMIWVFLMGY